MTSEGLFDGIYGRGRAAAEVSGEAWVRAMLEAEAALARVCTRENLIPPEAGEAIAVACLSAHFDVALLSREAAEHASPLVPLVEALRAEVGAELAEYVHAGATSQDMLDTAAMLVSSRATEVILEDARVAADAAARLAEEHRGTVMCGRTLLQQALPTTFGLRAAGWLTGIQQSRTRLEEVRAHELAAQMGGPVGTRPPRIAAAVAEELGLAEPVLPWHTIRVPVAALAGALGTLAGVLGKLARDVTLLAQDEIGELREGGGPGRGGSTAMGHKHNPVASVSVLACTRRVPGLVATILASMEQEHERAAGAWQAEWGTLTDLLALVGSAASWSRELLEQLQVDRERMRQNLARLADAGVAAAAEPERQLGAASDLIDRALAATRTSAEHLDKREDSQ